jgi:uncharacterized membrane protein YkoI
MRIPVIAIAFLAVAATTAQTQTISAARARQTALARVNNQQGVISEKLKTRNGILVYEFDIETPGPGHREIRVDANTGAIVANQHEDDLIGGTAEKVGKTADKAAHDVAKAANKVAKKADHEADKIFKKDEYAKANVHISETRARQIALARVANGSVKSIDLERENGITVWEVDVETPGKGHQELLIDAHSGVVLQQKHKK